MSDLKKEFTPEVIDAALVEIEKSLSTSKEITLEKSVDKRAMGGSQEKQPEHTEGAGRNYGDEKLPKPMDAVREVSKRAGNWATAYPMDTNKAEGSALSEAIEHSAKPSDRKAGVEGGLNKAVSSKDSKDSVEKAFGKESKDSKDSKESKESKKVEKAMGSKDSKDSKDSKKSKESKKSVEKGIASPKEETASESGAKSGAPQLNKSLSDKALAYVESAKKHLSKAFNNGSGDDLETAGQRLISAKKTVMKAIAAGETIEKSFVDRIDRSAKYFGKAIEAYEADKLDVHNEAMKKSEKHMSKAINEYTEFKKSLSSKKEISKSVDASKVTFMKQGNDYVATIDEATFQELSKSLNEKGLYKSVTDNLTKDDNKVVDAFPALKNLIKGLSESNNTLRDTIVTKSEEDATFKKSVANAVDILGKSMKSVLGDLEALKAQPNTRKSILVEQKSPLEAPIEGKTIQKSHVADILQKGFDKKIVDIETLLAWDVDKDYVSDVPQNYVALCEQIERS